MIDKRNKAGLVEKTNPYYVNQPQKPSQSTESAYDKFIRENGSENDPNYKGQPTGTGKPVTGSVQDVLGSMWGEDQFTTDYYANLANTATGAIDEDAIRKQKEAEYQAQIDSVNRLYADKLNQARIQGQGRLGSSTAMQARGGLLGSDFGAAQTSNVQAYNTDIENSVEAERQSALNDIFAEIRTNATAEIAAKRAAKEAGAKEYLQYLAGATERKATKHSNAAKILLSKWVDPKSVSDEELKKLGLTRDELTMAYNELKSGVDKAAQEEATAAETTRLGQEKTQAEINRINREASENYEVGGRIYNANGEEIAVKQGNNYEAGGKIYEAGTNKYLGEATKPWSGVSGTGGTGFVPWSSGMRTDRHNNPVAMTTDVARTLGLVEWVDYTKWDAFPNNPNLFTARLIGDGLQTTIKALDNAANDPNKSAFTTQSGQPRWTYINMSDQEWLSKTPEQKAQVIAGMYQKEWGNGQFTQGAATGGQQTYSDVKKGLIINDLDTAIEKIDTFATWGLWRNLAKGVPWTDAYDFAQLMETIKANIGFNELQEMRNASKTGGALGSVAVQELTALQSVLGSLDVGQSNEQLKANLKKIKDILTKWDSAKWWVQATPAQTGTPAPAQTGNSITLKNWATINFD